MHSLPQHDCVAERARRSAMIAERRHVHRWVRETSLPPHPEQPAAELALSKQAQRYIRRELGRASLNRALSLAAQRRRPWSLSSFAGLGPLIRPPAQTRRHWRDDRYLAWSLVAGVNPMQLALCECLPDDLRIPSAQVAPLLPAGLSFDQAMARGRVFLADFSAVEGLACLPGRYLAAPRLVLVLGDGGELRPVAITLRPQRDPKRPATVFTPLDSEWDWLGARAWVQNAANHTHQAIYHLMETHLIAEVASVSMRRNLAPVHPLYALLEPHMRECVGINEEARTLLLGRGGLVDRSMSAGGRGLVELIRRAWPTWRWSARTLEADLEGRGLASSATLPEYPYRDDARLVHAALRRYVTTYVEACYAEDREVVEDGELQAWLGELGDPEGGTVAGLPTLTTREDLSAFVSELMFKLTAQHGAMQHGQAQPYCPAGLYAPPPEAHGASEAGFVAMLPGPGEALSQLAAAHILARPVHEPLSA